jgi:predicted membrane channel-forming protein YqfA (hemolysin III family)
MKMNELHEKRKAAQGSATRQLAIWTTAWLLSQALLTFGSKLFWAHSDMANGLALILYLAMGFKMVLANRNLLKSLDELERQLQLESMAVTLGLTLVVGLGFSTLDIINMIPFDAEISYLVIFMGLSYLTTLLINKKRYQ